jgi:serine/threonine protein kinase
MEGIRFDEGYSIIESLLDKPKKQVWRVEDKTNRQECIVKKAFYDVKIDNKGLQEVITSSQLSHPNIVNYLGSWTEIHTPE